MTIQLELPQDLEQAVRRRAKESGREVSSWLVGFLRDTVVANNRVAGAAGPCLRPTEYPDEEIGEEMDYRPLTWPIVEVKSMRFVPGGRLVPPSYPDNRG